MTGKNLLGVGRGEKQNRRTISLKKDENIKKGFRQNITEDSFQVIIAIKSDFISIKWFSEAT